MVSVKSEHEIELMKHSGHINYLCHKLLEKKYPSGYYNWRIRKYC